MKEDKLNEQTRFIIEEEYSLSDTSFCDWW